MDKLANRYRPLAFSMIQGLSAASMQYIQILYTHWTRLRDVGYHGMPIQSLRFSMRQNNAGSVQLSRGGLSRDTQPYLAKWEFFLQVDKVDLAKTNLNGSISCTGF